MRLPILCLIVMVAAAAYFFSDTADGTTVLDAAGDTAAPSSATANPGVASPVQTVPFNAVAADAPNVGETDSRLDVVVVDADGEPVAGAEVAYARPSSRPLAPMSLVADAFARGTRTVTNARGEASLSAGEHGWVAARAEDGTALVRRDTLLTNRMIRLVATRGVRIAVEDSLGASAAGVPVLAVFAPGDDGTGLVLGRVLTDGTGVATFEGLAPLIASAGWDEERIVVQADVVGARVRAAYRDGARLVLPATTRLVVRLADRGRPAVARILPAAFDPTATLLEQFRIGAPLPPCVSAAPVTAAEAVFPCVATGTSLRVVVVDAESGALLGRAEIRADGAETVVTVTPDSVPALRGVVLTEGGTPCENVALRVVAGDFPVATATRGLVVTGKGGRVTLPASDDVIRRGLSGTVSLRTEDGAAELTVSAPPASAGTWTFGSAVLRRLPLVVAGRVVDDRRLAVRGARVVATAGDAEVLAVTDDDGAFKLHGAVDAAACRVQVFAPGHCGLDGRAMMAREVSIGRDDVVVRLSRTGGICGRVPTVAGAAAATLSVAATPGDHRVAVAPDGSFLLEEVAPGTVTVSLLAGETSVASVEGVVVRAGVVTDHPRLRTLAPVTALHAYSVRFVDERNDALGEVDARWTTKDGESLFPGRNGPASFEFLAAVDTVRVRAGAPGHGTVERVLRPGVSVVALHRGPTVRLRMTPEGAKQFAGKLVSVSLVPEGPERGLGASSEPRPVQGGGEWTLRVGAAGSYRIDVVAFPVGPVGEQDGVVSFDGGVVAVGGGTEAVHTIDALTRQRTRDGE